MSHDEVAFAALSTCDDGVTTAWSSARRVRLAVVSLLAACTGSDLGPREQRIVASLHEDNRLWAERDRELVELKLVKMQRDPYTWLRGTASLWWRDIDDPGGDRLATAFGSPEASRVLLVADPHPENVGTFRAADGVLFVDWNDFDGTGYGPYTIDVRRLAAGLIIAAEDEALADELSRRVAAGYTRTIAMLATGARIGPVIRGAHPLFDDELATAESRGNRLFAVNEVAPVDGDGVRRIAYVDLEDVAPDGLIEDRLVPVSPEIATLLDQAIDAWGRDAGAVKLRARRIGSGVASYAAARYNVVLEGATPAVDDDRIVELKETREGYVARGVPLLASAEWVTPAARAVDTQRRLHARADGDPLLGHALVGGLSLKIRDREAYQRGLDREDLTELAAGTPAEREQLLALADLLGSMLARAHGQATTADGVAGWTVIAPLLAGREEAFAGELATHALADARQVIADHASMQGRDLAALVLLGEVP